MLRKSVTEWNTTGIDVRVKIPELLELTEDELDELETFFVPVSEFVDVGLFEQSYGGQYGDLSLEIYANDLNDIENKINKVTEAVENEVTRIIKSRV